jgi:DNA-3-methyladenine glycosylase
MTKKNRLLLQSLRTILGSSKQSRHSELAYPPIWRVSESKNWIPDRVRNDKGSKPPFLILENTAQNRLKDLGVVLRHLKHPQLKICLDFAHAYQAGYDLNTSKGINLLFYELNHHIGFDNLVCIHANDSLTKFSSHHDRHADILQGNFKPHPFFIFFNHSKTNHLPFILETPAIKKEKIPGQKKNLQKLIQLHGTHLDRSFFARKCYSSSGVEKRRSGSSSSFRPNSANPPSLKLRRARASTGRQARTARNHKASTLTIARELLGQYLVISTLVVRSPRTPGVGNHPLLVARITETEAYIGVDDLACHASKGKTARTKIMWDSPGKLYVYLIYGMYHCLNIVTEKKGFPAAVLIRGAQPIFGFPTGTKLDGPGKLCRALGLTRKHTGLDVTTSKQILLKDIGVPIPASQITTTPRINVDYAGAWAAKPWRFILKDS